MTRIVLVGAGSVEFTRNLLGDILSYPELQDAEIVLHDIDADRLTTAERMAAWTAGALGAAPAISGSLDRREALAGADFVINTIQVGGARATQIDFDIPGRYGLALHDQRHDQRRRGAPRPADDPGRPRDCPRTWRTSARTRCSSTTRTRWGCSSGRSTRRSGRRSPASATPSTGRSTAWPEYLGIPPAEVDALSAGVNHLAWILRLEHRGRDLYPDLHAFVEAGRVPDDDLVRADLFRRFGFYPTESSEHHAEYNPWFIPKGQVEPFHVPIGEYLSRVANNLDEYDDTKRRLDAGEPFEIERSGEYAAVIIHVHDDRRCRPGSSPT